MYLIIVGIILLFCFYLGVRKSVKYKSFFKYCFLSFAILLVLEFTLFNFRSYESMFYKEIIPTEFSIGEGIERQKDGSLMVTGDKLNYIEFKGFSGHIKNIYIDLDSGDGKNLTVDASIGYTDAANYKYAYAQSRSIPAFDNSDGEYLKMHLSGNTRRIRIYINTIEEEDTFRVNKVSFNKPVPFTFSILRPILILSLLVLIYIFRPKSSIYKMTFNDINAKKYIFIACGLELLVLGIVNHSNFYFVKEDFKTKQRYQYQMLTESFLNGHPYLDEEPSEILKGLRNPYDKRLRQEAFKDQEKESYIWDAAYFNNKYYVYFGVAPVITYYLPYYVLTHHHIKTSTCIFITLIATTIGIFLLLYHLCKKYFPKTSVGMFITIALLFINACGLLSIAGRPDHYSLPLLMGIMFSIYGLFWWIKASEENLNAKYLFLGSLCMAAVAACRPQLLLTSFFIFPIFWGEVKKRNLLSKSSIGKSIALVLPYIVIAILLMWYNYIRFGSPFDFGANYNLTTNDMTKRGFVLGRIPLGIFYYLLYPIQFILKFPFFQRSGVATNYIGTTIYEDMGAGFIIVNLLTLFGIFIYKYRHEFKNKMLYQIGLLSVIFSFIIIIADTQMAGILPRYICDFGYLLYLATSLVLFHVLNKKLDSNKKDILHKIIYICFIIGIVYNFLLLCSDSVFIHSQFFFYLRRLFEFWV